MRKRERALGLEDLDRRNEIADQFYNLMTDTKVKTKAETKRHDPIEIKTYEC